MCQRGFKVLPDSRNPVHKKKKKIEKIKSLTILMEYHVSYNYTSCRKVRVLNGTNRETIPPTHTLLIYNTDVRREGLTPVF